jgi:two-component system, cell cycle sensor histidine kinase and response regulator CckA
MFRLPAHVSRWFSEPTALNAYLVRLIFVGLVPILVFSIFMMVLFARQEQANRQRGLEDTARALALAIDREMESSITNLQALATSESLDVGAVNVFRSVAARILRTQRSWKSISLFDPQGRQLAQLTKPLVDTPKGISRESLDAVLRTRRPFISDFPQVESPESGVNIHVPVVREQTIIYILTAAIEPQVFTDILLQQKLPPSWVGTVYDSQYITIARTRDAAKYLGKAVGPLLQQTGIERSEQFVSGTSADQTRAYAAISRSHVSNWFVALTVPSAEVNAILYRSLATLGAGGLLLMLIGLGAALIFARRVAYSIGELAAAAHRLGRGEAVALTGNLPVAELDSLAVEMARAGELLADREKERDRVEIALRQHEQFLRRQADLLNFANEAILAWELRGPIIYWNHAAEQLYGYAQHEALGRSSHELLQTEFPDGRAQFETELVRRGEWSGESKQVTKHGRRIEVESRFKLIEDRAGSRLILECNRDISHRKQSARRLATEHAATLVLAESETLEMAWRKMLEIIAEGLDWELAMVWLVNKQIPTLERAEIWQHPALELSKDATQLQLARGVGLAGRVWASEEPIWVSDLIKEAEVMRRGIPGDARLHGAFGFPIKIRGEVLGVVVFVSTTVRAPDDDLLNMAQALGGEIGQFVERMRAEAALRQSEEHLRNQAQELEQQLLASGRLVAVGELTASMAHEFNNPLGIVLGFAQGLLANMDSSDPNYHHVQIISEEAKRCEKLVQELLEFGRPKNADFAWTDVQEMIQKTLDLVQPRAGKSKIEAFAKLEGELPQIHADPQQLQQVLLNLSLNAVDAMPKGGMLTIAAKQESPSRLTITVADTGIGIEPDVLPRIFQPFFTSKKRRGLGLGLPICDRIVKAHGGRIEVNSIPGEGTRFTIRLPINGSGETSARPETMH